MNIKNINNEQVCHKKLDFQLAQNNISHNEYKLRYFVAFLYSGSWLDIEQNIDNNIFDFDLKIPFHVLPQFIKNQILCFFNVIQDDADEYFIDLPLLMLMFDNFVLYNKLKQKHNNYLVNNQTAHNFESNLNNNTYNKTNNYELNYSPLTNNDLINGELISLFKIAFYYDNLDILKEMRSCFYSDNNELFNKDLANHLSQFIQNDGYVIELNKQLKQKITRELDQKNIDDDFSEINPLGQTVYPFNCLTHVIDYYEIANQMIPNQALLYTLIYNDKNNFEKLIEKCFSDSKQIFEVIIGLLMNLSRTDQQYSQIASEIFIKLFAWINGQKEFDQNTKDFLYNKLFNIENSFEHNNLSFWSYVFSCKPLLRDIQNYFDNKPLKIDITSGDSIVKYYMYAMFSEHEIAIDQKYLINQFKNISPESSQFNMDNFSLLLIIKQQDEQFFKDITHKAMLGEKLYELLQKINSDETNNFENYRYFWETILSDPLVQDYFKSHPVQLKMNSDIDFFEKYKLLDTINSNLIDQQFLLNSMLNFRNNIDSDLKNIQMENCSDKNFIDCQNQIYDDLEIINSMYKNNKDLLIQYEKDYGLISLLTYHIKYIFPKNGKNAILPEYRNKLDKLLLTNSYNQSDQQAKQENNNETNNTIHDKIL